MRKSDRMSPWPVALFATAAVALTVAAPWPAFADGEFDAGLKMFKAKRYAEAAKMFERASAATPWESAPIYYAGLSYHYARDYKQAIAKYDGLVQKFPGTSASDNALAALKVIDPGYLKRKASDAALSASAAASSVGGGASAAKSEDKGTVEGELQTRVYFSKQGDDKLVDVRVGGRTIRVIVDPLSEGTAFSRGQLAALGIQASGKEVRVDLQMGGVVRKNFPVTIDDTVGSNPKVGHSYLGAFVCDVDNAASFFDLKRKSVASAAGRSSSSGNEISFKREGQDVIVNVEVNGRGVAAIFDPKGNGVVMSAKAARAVGLKIDDAEEAYKSPAEGPQRGEPGWVAPEDKPAASKYLSVQRMRFGPVDRSDVQVQVNESSVRYPKIGADFVSGGWKFDIDYSANIIRFKR